MGDIQSISKQRKSKASQPLDVSKPTSRKASRSLTPVPEQLGKLLKLVNVVPPDAELPDITETLNGSPYTQESTLLHEIDRICKDLPKLIIIYLWLGEERLLGILDDDPVVIRDTVDLFERLKQDEQDADDDAEWSEEDQQKSLNQSGYSAGLRYTYLRESRAMLRDIARHAKSQSVYIAKLPETRLSLSTGSIIIRRDGHLKYVPPRFVKAIDGVEAARIRECEVCNLLFWAGRLDQKACTTKCARVLRTRRWRANYQTTYKQQRIRKDNKREAAKLCAKQSDKKERS